MPPSPIAKADIMVGELKFPNGIGERVFDSKAAGDCPSRAGENPKDPPVRGFGVMPAIFGVVMSAKAVDGIVDYRRRLRECAPTKLGGGRRVAQVPLIP